jgi:predicted enzyme related to lactoylglutathione lyase
MADGRRNALNWFEIPSDDFERAKNYLRLSSVA